MSNSTANNHEPQGFKFMDAHYGEVIFIQKGAWTGWIARKHPDGFWTSLRLANADDLETVKQRIAAGN